MLARTKKHHTESELCFVGPKERREEALKAAREALKPYGFTDVGESIPWRECFPELSDDQLPGISLTGARGKEGLTQRQLSEKTGIPQRHISEMENGKRQIGKERAKKLAEALNVSYKIFL